MKSEWIAIGVLGATVFLCAVQISRQLNEMTTLREALDELETEGQVSRHKVELLEENSALMESRIAATEEENAVLQSQLRVVGGIRSRRQGAGYKVESRIAEGFYSLSSPIAFDDDTGEQDEVRQCSLYNTTFDLGGDPRGWRLNFGVALCGIGRPTLYIDYDSDGLVDVKLLAWIGDMIIGVGTDVLSGGATFGIPTLTSAAQGGVLAKATENGQSAYDAFLLNRHKATYISLDEIEEKGGYWGRWTWQEIERMQSELLAWLELQGILN